MVVYQNSFKQAYKNKREVFHVSVFCQQQLGLQTCLFNQNVSKHLQVERWSRNQQKTVDGESDEHLTSVSKVESCAFIEQSEVGRFGDFTDGKRVSNHC